MIDPEASSDVFDDDENEIAEVLKLAENQKQLKNHLYSNDEYTDGKREFIVTLKIPMLGKNTDNLSVNNVNSTSSIHRSTVSNESIAKNNELANDNQNLNANIPNDRSILGTRCT